MAWAPDYLSFAAGKKYLGEEGRNNNDDNIASWITAASRAIDRHCLRQFGRHTTPITVRKPAVRSRRDGLWWVRIPDLMGEAATAALTVTVAGVTVTEYDLLPDDAPMRQRPYERLVFRATAERQPSGARLEVGLSAPWGWSSIPATVRAACKLQLGRFNIRPNSPYGTTGGSAQGTAELRLLERVDPDVGLMLRDYVRRWGAA